VADSPARGNPPDDPLGKNPFHEDDPRYDEWVDMTRLGRELSAVLLSDLLSTIPPEEAAVREFQEWAVRGAV
jgi:hypothetical protein